MRSAQFKAIFIILLIFGGLGWYIFGGNVSLPSLPNFSEWFQKEETNTASKSSAKKNNNSSTSTGQVIDSYKGVKVYYNGRVGNVSGRNTTKDGYNLGLKYQCVEFAKRFYYEAYSHKMPDSYGHARDFFDGKLAQGEYNKARGMRQYKNGGNERPRVNDLVIIGPSTFNSFGHLFIITKVTNNGVEFIQQNPGPRNPSRGSYPLVNSNGHWSIKADDVVGWLRLS